VTTWIRSPEELADAARHLAACAAIALDSESDSLHHHVEKVCLLQIAADTGEVYLVDPLAFKDLSALAPVLADPGVVKVLHGADYDVSTLKRDFGFGFAALFDTMLAARLLGRRELGLQALCAAELGVTLSKDSQRDDWSRRPLTPKQEHYAAEDVRHLIALRARLHAALVERGRLAWLDEECAAVAALEPAARRADADAWLRVKGASRLAPRALAVLRELHAWRERLAETTDVPAFRLMGTDTLLALAGAPPRDVPALLRLRGLSPFARRQAGELMAAVRRALELPAAAWPAFPRPPRPVIPEDVQRRAKALRAWRAAEAARLELDVSVVLPQRLLDKVAEAAPRTPGELAAVPGLRRWRIDAFGPALLDAVARAV
jgi:ribonuclease D